MVQDGAFDDLKRQIAGLEGIDPARHGTWAMDTRLVRGYGGIDGATGALSVPIYPSATFAHPGYDRSTGFMYGRCGNPTRLALEDSIAMLEGGCKAWAFSSGMAALSTLLKLFDPGDHIIVGDDLYGGTYRLMDQVYARFGLEFEYIDATDLSQVRRALRPNTRALFVETPTNPMMKVVDLAGLSVLIKEAGGLFIVDNTLLTPYFQRPFEQGADIVVHSATKYLCGHNDILCGLVVIREPALIEPLFMLSMSEGGMLSPHDSWLLQRSIKTLGLRLEKQQQNAFELVGFLKAHPRVKAVHYVGDPDHPGYGLSKKQASGFGGMVSFSLESPQLLKSCLGRLRLVLYAESLGGVETLITYPLEQTHGAVPEELRERLGINDRLLRLSVGIEDPRDLIEDLDQALSV
ncbi:MAG: PLP-dependent aspartate aminotransferase family protein [Coriobacteriaceae bacterium]|jgi:cystathionine gamma-synthase|nr:PLP-dependent aspartate aminotransferase family protein [Coriobacteriaceae bacterium]